MRGKRVPEFKLLNFDSPTSDSGTRGFTAVTMPIHYFFREYKCMHGNECISPPSPSIQPPPHRISSHRRSKPPSIHGKHELLCTSTYIQIVGPSPRENNGGGVASVGFGAGRRGGHDPHRLRRRVYGSEWVLIVSRLVPDVRCQNLRNCPDFSQTRGSVPIAAGPSVLCSIAINRALRAASAQHTFQMRCSSRNAFELERYRTEQSLHRLRRVGGDPHECQSNSMNLSQRHAADAAPW